MVWQSWIVKLSAAHLSRYKDIALLLWKYGRTDVVRDMGLEDGFEVPKERAPEEQGDALPEQLAKDLEAMGPTFVKLGQVLSGRPDLLPPDYLKALERLHDKVEPFPYAEVEQIVTSELGVRISKAFSEFDPEPIAAASLGQVHRAALRDGRRVVVKVQRPNIRAQIAEDFEVLTQIAALLDTHTDVGRRYRFGRILGEFRATIQRELNYDLEARNLVAIGRNLREFTLIEIPQPIADFSTKSVLTMERVDGVKITALSPVARLDIDGESLAEELFKAYLQQVLVDGLFHADPHPGNVFLTEDRRVALLDLGMVGHVSPSMQDHLLKLLLAMSEANGEDAANVVIAISETTEDFDQVEFRRRITQQLAAQQGQELQSINVGVSVLDVSTTAAELGLYVPSELTLLGKTLLQLDQIGKLLDPAFDPPASIQRNVADLMSQRVRKQATQGSAFRSLIEMKEFVSGLPVRLNGIMDAVVNKELEVKVRTTDASLVMEAFEKIANRITTGLVLAALIIGASVLMQVRTTFTIWGYPGLAMVCFLAAATGGFWLVISIVIQDQDNRKHRKK